MPASLLMCLDNGRNGLYVPVADAAALRTAVVKLFNDNERAAAMGKQGRHDAEARFGVDRWVKEINQVIDRAIAQDKRRGKARRIDRLASAGRTA